MLSLLALGVQVDVAASSPAALDQVRSHWSRCLARTAAPSSRVVALHGRDGGAAAGAALTARITESAVTALAGTCVLLHACGLSDDRGRTLVLVGPSGAGKSTAAALLAREHFGYVTDECVGVEPSGRVRPYPKPLALGLDASLGEVQVGPDDLGLRTCTDDLSLAGLVLLDRDDDVRDPVASPVLLVDALLHLVPETSALTTLDRPLVRLCQVHDHAGGVVRLRYADMRNAGDVLLGLLEQRSSPPELWRPLDHGDPSDPSWRLRDGRVRRRPVRDAVAVGAEIVLLVDDRPVRLSPVAATIWRACSRPMTVPQLTEAVVAEHGPHPDAAVRVHEAVTAMARARAVACAAPVAPEHLLMAEKLR